MVSWASASFHVGRPSGADPRFEEFGPFHRPKVTKEKSMDNQTRVLIRRRARELTPTEADLINGGFVTLSLCTNSPSPDGDHHPGEVGC
jgi:hypothetical protein